MSYLAPDPGDEPQDRRNELERILNMLVISKDPGRGPNPAGAVRGAFSGLFWAHIAELEEVPRR